MVFTLFYYGLYFINVYVILACIEQVSSSMLALNRVLDMLSAAISQLIINALSTTKLPASLLLSLSATQ